MLFSPMKESLHQKLVELSVEDTLQAVMNLLQESYCALQSCLEADTKFDKRFIKAIAQIRFSVMTFMDIVVRKPDSQNSYTCNGEKVQELMSLLKKICLDSSINGRHIGPNTFMLRLIYRTYGKEFVFSGVRMGAYLFNFEWLIPHELRDDSVSGQ